MPQDVRLSAAVACAHGFCASHYGRWRDHQDPLAGGTSKGDLRRFINDVAIPYDGDECLRWPFASNNGRGYAIFKADGGKDYAHRLVCEAAHGPPPTPRSFAIHSCGNGHLGCVTKRHLRWGTQKENGQDMVAHGTSPRGEKHGSSKLTTEQVLGIRRPAGRSPHKALAQTFAVSPGTVSDIGARRTWAWLD